MKRFIPLIAAFAAAVLLAACGGGGNSSDSSTSSEAGGSTAASGTSAADSSAPLANALPAKYRGKSLKVSFGVGYPPMGFTDSSGNLTGVNIDLANAVGEELGVTIEPSVVQFETVIPAIQSEKFDASFFGASVSEEREKVLDMATYVEDANGFLTGANDPEVGKSPKDLCGEKIAIVSGEVTIPELEKISEECQSEGQQAITLQTYPNNPEANLAVQGGKADIALSPVSSAGYIVKQNPEYKITGPELEPTKIAAISNKGNGLAEALEKAINALIKDGKYQEILAKYGASANAIKQSELNPTS